jgi:hypothetical protein
MDHNNVPKMVLKWSKNATNFKKRTMVLIEFIYFGFKLSKLWAFQSVYLEFTFFGDWVKKTVNAKPPYFKALLCISHGELKLALGHKDLNSRGFS